MYRTFNTAFAAYRNAARERTVSCAAVAGRWGAGGLPRSGGVVTETTTFDVGAIALQSDGKLVASLRGPQGFRLKRYGADGSVDTTFGDAGVVTAALRYWTTGASAILVEPDGSVVAAVSNFSFTTGGREGGLFRFDSLGRLDHRFGYGGYATTPDVLPFDVARQPDARLVVGGWNGTFPADFTLARYDGTCPAMPDGDGDGIGDACDPCTGPAVLERATLQIRGIGGSPDDETLRFGATFALGATIDPVADGVRFVLQDAGGEFLFDTVIPPGAFDPGLQIGWSADPTGTRFQYKSRSPINQPRDGITLVSIRRVNGRVMVKVKGARGNFGIAPSAVPAKATLILDAPRSELGRCVEATFAGPPPAPTCTFTSSGTGVRCR